MMNAWLESQIRSSSLLYPLWQKYVSLSRREQRMLLLMVSVLLLAVMYLSVWKPVKDKEVAAELNQTHTLDTYYKLVENAEALGKHVGSEEVRFEDRSASELQGLISRTMRQHRIIAQRISLDGDSRVQVWIEDSRYAPISQWLGTLANEKVAIYRLQINSSDPGMVNVRITLD